MGVGLPGGAGGLLFGLGGKDGRSLAPDGHDIAQFVDALLAGLVD